MTKFNQFFVAITLFINKFFVANAQIIKGISIVAVMFFSNLIANNLIHKAHIHVLNTVVRFSSFTEITCMSLVAGIVIISIVIWDKLPKDSAWKTMIPAFVISSAIFSFFVRSVSFGLFTATVICIFLGLFMFVGEIVSRTSPTANYSK